MSGPGVYKHWWLGPGNSVARKLIILNCCKTQTVNMQRVRAIADQSGLLGEEEEKEEETQFTLRETNKRVKTEPIIM